MGTMCQVIAACDEAKTVYEKPTAIICHTIPGKGVSFMENQYEWHGKAPTEEQGDIALAQLDAEGKKIQEEIAKLKEVKK